MRFVSRMETVRLVNAYRLITLSLQVVSGWHTECVFLFRQRGPDFMDWEVSKIIYYYYLNTNFSLREINLQ